VLQKLEGLDMREAFLKWFEPSAFSPHGFCLLWEPGLIWLHSLSDVVIALAYFSIPLAIAAFLRERRDFEYRWVGWLFAAFILACGTSHVVSVVTLWQPYYWLEGGVKAITALVSLATAVLLWPLIPKALALPSPAHMRQANTELASLVQRLERRETELLEVTANLQERITETAGLAAANIRFETALAASGVTVVTQDAQLVYTYISKGELGLAPEDFIGRTDAQVLPPNAYEQAHAIKRGVLESGKPARGEVFAGGQWFDLIVERLPNGEGVICGAIDITRRKQDEERIAFLLNEVKHRVGNLLAVAQAMLRQTARASDSVNDLVKRFGHRLQALGLSQNLLLRPSEQPATLAEVVRTQLDVYSDPEYSQVSAQGPEVMLEPQAVMHLGMALHELATNAAKYGALSVPGGHITVDWHIQDGEVSLVWRESGGPLVAPPSRKGFGTEVVEWAVARAVAGRVLLSFPPEGLTWELRFPLQA